MSGFPAYSSTLTRRLILKRTDFQFELPDRQIAQLPLPERSASRLLKLDRFGGAVTDMKFKDLPNLLEAGDLLVRNNTRVIPARLFARKETGGRVEILVERLSGNRHCIAQLRASKSPRPGTALVLENGVVVHVTGRQDSFFKLELAAGQGTVSEQLSELGHVPLPPYIQRDDCEADRERYQTVYAQISGAVAAPTAGLHFDENMFAELAAKGVESAELTLHVGAGTFTPVRTDRIEDHRMHAEYLEVSAQCCAAVSAAKQRGSRVIAVGTTVVRSLETAAPEMTRIGRRCCCSLPVSLPTPQQSNVSGRLLRTTLNRRGTVILVNSHLALGSTSHIRVASGTHDRWRVGFALKVPGRASSTRRISASSMSQLSKVSTSPASRSAKRNGMVQRYFLRRTHRLLRTKAAARQYRSLTLSRRMDGS